MKWYWKMLRRLISHPSYGLQLAREFQKRHIYKWERYCLKCGCIWWQHIHKHNKVGSIVYKCSHCKQHYWEFYGTIFENTKVWLDKWMILILEWCVSTGSTSWAEASRRIWVSKKTSWNMLTKIRRLLHETHNSELLSGIVEADEAWMGKKKNQDIIMWMVERWKRKLQLYSIENVQEKTLYPLIKKNVEYRSKFFTDMRVSYHTTSIRYLHWTTNHSKGEFARWEVHSNTIEQIWGDIKGIIRTIHHWVSKKYRLYYLAQYITKYENIKLNDLFYFTLSKILITT